MGQEIFKKVASVARLKKKNLKKPDKTPYAYNQQSFSLDGMMSMDITFNDVTLTTPVYIKLDSKDQLLLSEGVCRQLGIVQYHPKVKVWQSKRSNGRVTLVQSCKVLPHTQTVVTATVHVPPDEANLVLLDSDIPMHSGLKVLEGIISVQPDSTGKILIENTSGFTQALDANELLGHTSFVQAVDLKSLDDMHCDHSPLEHGQELYDYIIKSQAQVNFVQSDDSHSRQARLYQLIKWDPSTLQNDDSSKLKSLMGVTMMRSACLMMTEGKLTLFSWL